MGFPHNFPHKKLKKKEKNNSRSRMNKIPGEIEPTAKSLLRSSGSECSAGYNSIHGDLGGRE